MIKKPMMEELEYLLRRNAMSMALENKHKNKRDDHVIFDIHNGMSSEEILEEILGHTDGDKYLEQKPKKNREPHPWCSLSDQHQKRQGTGFHTCSPGSRPWGKRSKPGRRTSRALYKPSAR
jgi:hypothetical protein